MFSPRSGSGASDQPSLRNSKDAPALGLKQSFFDYESRLRIWSLGADVPATKMVPAVINCGLEDVPKIYDRAVRLFEMRPQCSMTVDAGLTQEPLVRFLKDLKDTLKLTNETSRAVTLDEYNRIRREPHETYEEFLERNRKVPYRMVKEGVAVTESHACNKLMMGLQMSHVESQIVRSMFRFDEIDDDPSNRGKWFDKLVKVVEDVILPTQKAQSPSGAGATGVVRLQNTDAAEADSVGTGDMMMWSKGAGKGSWRGQDSSYSGKGYGKDPWANWGYENDWSWYPERNWQMRGAYSGGWESGKGSRKGDKGSRQGSWKGDKGPRKGSWKGDKGPWKGSKRDGKSAYFMQTTADGVEASCEEWDPIESWYAAYGDDQWTGEPHGCAEEENPSSVKEGPTSEGKPLL